MVNRLDGGRTRTSDSFTLFNGKSYTLFYYTQSTASQLWGDSTIDIGTGNSGSFTLDGDTIHWVKEGSEYTFTLVI